MDAAQYDALVAGFYRAATGEIAWEEALEPMRLAFRCVTVTAETYDVPSRTMLSLQYTNPALHPAALDYLRLYNIDNPRLAMGLAEKPRTWVYCHEHISDEAVAHDRVYQEFYIPYDLRYAAGAYLPVDERTATCMGAMRSHREGPIEGTERQWLERLGAHLLDARAAYERVRRLASQALAGSTLLNSFPYPMWLIDGDRHLFFANGRAEQDMRHGRRAVLRGGTRLVLTSSEADRTLGLQLLTLYDQGHGAHAVLDLRSARTDPPVLLHLQLLVPEQALNAFGTRPLLLATLFDAQQVNSLDPFALARIFQFTPAEAKVATQLADGMTAEQIALVNGTRVSTVRTQISNVLAKLGVARQAEAVRVLRQGGALWARRPV